MAGQKVEGPVRIGVGLVGLAVLRMEPEQVMLAEAGLQEPRAAATHARERRLAGLLLLLLETVVGEEEVALRQRWVVAIKTKNQLLNVLPIILNFVIGIIN